MKQTLQSLATCALIGSMTADVARADSMYNAIKSEVSIYNQVNFQKQVINNREKGISIVQYYKGSESDSKNDKSAYEVLSMEYKGMFRIGAVNCEDFPKICEKEGVQHYPSYKVYPPVPAPVIDMPANEAGKTVDIEALKKAAFRHVGNRVIDISSKNYKTFKEDNVGKPKMLLFTDKKSTPITYRALSTYFDQTLEFGIAKAEDADLVKQFKVTKFPALFMLKANDKPKQFEGDSFKYKDMFEFINIYSETFVFVGDLEQKEVKSAASKEWMNMAVPYLTKDSGNDICLQKDGTLCVIYVVPSKAESSMIIMDEIEKLESQFSSKIERGINFNFIRLDATLEPEFSGMFGDYFIEPFLVVMNPGKRKRFLKHEGDLTATSISKTLDTILGGDARFKAIKDFKTLESSYDMYVQ